MEDYELIQINLNGSKAVWDEKDDETRIRIYEIEEELDVFEEVFQDVVNSNSASEIAENIQEVNL